MDPFLDPCASPKEERQPTISGLCRCFKNFHTTYIYLTTVDDRVCSALSIPIGSYLGIAALKVVKEYPSHAKAAQDFKPRQYLVAPDLMPYPPNLAHDPQMPAAVCPESCIIWPNRHTPLTPDHFDEAMWSKHVTDYHQRQADKQLRAATCRFVQVDGREVLQLDHEHAPVLTPADWGEKKRIPRGNFKPQEDDWKCADHLYQKIANGRYTE